MPKNCCVVSCTNNVNSRPDLQFYILTAKKAQRKLWLTAINRVRTDELGNPIKGTLWSPKSKHHYVCSEHFISGKRELALSHPDYVPSVFKVLSCGKKVASPH
ncbi:THAP domain-containing protein 11-like [Hydractinia symbiolongicarpus]|uniref:THAP domain-containing protein 11-like n=1 Tax=Hydractinia symbiolongicarpus TaxID=13093 RepID=UPI00254E129D|nr:THAP domain-containing protein 11-like [Hydractinia symbiolongicarpus]